MSAIASAGVVILTPWTAWSLLVVSASDSSTRRAYQVAKEA